MNFSERTHFGSLCGGAAILWVELLVVALAAPALWFPTVRVSLTLLAILLLLVTWLAVALVEGMLWPRSSLDLPLLGILLMAALGAWTSTSPQLTLPKVTGLILGLAAYRAILRCARGIAPTPGVHAAHRDPNIHDLPRPHADRGTTLVLVGGLLLLACGFSIIGLVGGIRAAKLSALSPAWARIPRFLGALPGTQDGLISTNQLGGALLFVLPLSISLLLVGRPSPPSPSPADQNRRGAENAAPLPPSPGIGRGAGGEGLSRLLFLLFTSFLGPALILTQSRSAIAGLAAALLLIVGLRWPWGRWLMLAIGLASFIGWLFWGRWSLAPMVVQALTKEGWASPIGKLWIAGRFAIWARAWRAILAGPLLGGGLGTFRVLDAVSKPGASIFDAGTPHAHNVFLQIGYDVGLPGLAAYLALLAVAACRAVRTYRLGTEPWRALAIGSLAALLGSHLYGLFDVVALGSKPGVLWWGLLAIIAALPTGIRTNTPNMNRL